MPEKTDREHSLANLKPYKPGQSGNPAGRPKNTLTAAYRRMLGQPFPGDAAGRTYAEVIAEAVGAKAARGEERAAKEIEDRVIGKARQHITLAADRRDAIERSVESLLETAKESGDELDRMGALQLLAERDEDAALYMMEFSSEAEQ